MSKFLNIQAAFSPCPNDVFLFYPWKENKISTYIKLHLKTFDINTLNKLAQNQSYPLIKISAALYPKISEYYEILPVGITLGYNCGPLLIKSQLNKSKTIKTLASPGLNTTAQKLFCRYFSSEKNIFISYDKILPKILKNDLDSGLLIHESRFNLPKEIDVLADLGNLWLKETKLPIPLGCIAISRNLPLQLKRDITSVLKECFIYSKTFLESTIKFAITLAKEKNAEIIKRFINTYVSSDLYSISPKGISSLEYFWNHLNFKKWLTDV